MQLYNTYSSQEFRKKHTLMITQQWDDYDDFINKYGNESNIEAWTSWLSLAAFFNGIGVLVKRGKIEIDVVEELLANTIFVSWYRMQPIIIGWRKGEDPVSPDGRSSKYPFLHGFEYLYNELNKRDPRTNR